MINIEFIKSIVESNQFAQGGLVIALLSSILYTLKPIPGSIYRQLKKLIYYEISIYLNRDDDTYAIFSDWYNQRYPNKYRRAIGQIVVISPTEGGPRLVKPIYRQDSDVNYIWYHRRFIRIEKIRAKLEHASNSHDAYTDEYHISGLFAANAILNLFNSVVESHQTSLIGSSGIPFRTYNPGYGQSVFNTIYKFKTFDQIYFPGKDKLLEYLDGWRNNKWKSDQMGINHKTGISLYGPPGTGKTSIAKAIAHRYKMELNLISLGSFKSDSELINYIQGLQSSSVLLFEDIDDYTSTQIRSNLNKKSNISFSTLLQILDGVVSPDNVIFMFTTNHIEDFDPALYRDGRINFRLLVDYPSKSDIKEFVETYYGIQITQDLNFKPQTTMSTIEQMLLRHLTIESFLTELNGV